MAGSQKWMVYTSDKAGAPDAQGNATSLKYACKVDESNGNIFGFSAPTNQAALDALPKMSLSRKRNQDVIARYVNWVGKTQGGKTVSRRIPVGAPDNQYFRNGGSVSLWVQTSALTGELVTGAITFAGGENHQFATVVDTGLDDGTAD